MLHAAVFCATAFLSTPAQAAAPPRAAPVHPGTPADSAQFLSWHAPPGCPTRDAVYQRTADTVGYAPEQGRFESVEGRIVEVGGRWALTLDFVERGASSRRELRAERCSDLEGAAAIAIALALGAEKAEPRTTSEPSATDTDANAADGNAAEPTATELAPHTAPRAADPTSDQAPEPAGESSSLAARLGASAQVALDVASVGQAALGLSLGGRARWARFEVGLDALWLPEVERRVGSGEAVGFSLLSLGPRGCYWLLDGDVGLGGCGFVEAGRFSASGAGLSADARQFDRGWLAAGLGLELEAHLVGPLRARLGGDVLRPLLREDYTINDTETVYRAPELSLRVQAGLVLSAD